jgi:hypothetical protein
MAEPQKFIYYHYNPSLGAAVAFIILFSFSTTYHFYQLLRYRAWFFIAFLVGCICQSATNHSFNHAQPAHHPFTKTFFIYRPRTDQRIVNANSRDNGLHWTSDIGKGDARLATRPIPHTRLAPPPWATAARSVHLHVVGPPDSSRWS